MSKLAKVTISENSTVIENDVSHHRQGDVTNSRCHQLAPVDRRRLIKAVLEPI